MTASLIWPTFVPFSPGSSDWLFHEIALAHVMLRLDPRKDQSMKWKTIGICLLIAGFMVGCGSTRTARYRSDRDYDRYAYSERTTYVDSDWATIRTGMTERQVANRLGTPRSERHFRNGRETWLYSDGGQVHFNSRNRVSSWREPSYAGRTRTYRTYSRSDYDDNSLFSLFR